MKSPSNPASKEKKTTSQESTLKKGTATMQGAQFNETLTLQKRREKSNKECLLASWFNVIDTQRESNSNLLFWPNRTRAMRLLCKKGLITHARKENCFAILYLPLSPLSSPPLPHPPLHQPMLSISLCLSPPLSSFFITLSICSHLSPPESHSLTNLHFTYTPRFS